MQNSKKLSITLGLLSIAVVLFIGSHLAPRAIVIDSLMTLFIATGLYYFISALLSLFLGVSVLELIRINPSRVAFIVIISIAVCFTSSGVGLLLTDYLLSGFDIVGFWPHLILILCTGSTVCQLSVQITIPRR